ncbi:MAG: hypothetical protein CL609_08335 [Anaerolineaceae bacterium]|nr:hypothetical protein [Anaerolineaceae bacterium]
MPLPSGYNPPDMNGLKNELNEQQYQAVTAGLGQTLVLAGPGSGKTRVLTHRIAYLIDDLGVRPYNIVAVTFTNKAAREMKNRVEKMLVAGQAEGLWLGTFHSICARILRREAQYLPVDSNFVIFDVEDQVSLIKNIIKDLNLNDKLYRPNQVQSAISRAKNEMITPKEYLIKTSRDQTIRDIYERYEKGLRISNAVDFDDLLLLALYLLHEVPEVRERYARRFEYVLVDEFQDTNTIQYELVKQFASYHKNLFVVGDEDQSIYRWRGADYRNVLRFEEEYNTSDKILLEQNYRSTQTVLDVARAVIDRNMNRTRKELFTNRGAGDKIHFYSGDDDRDEADYVVRTIQSEMRSGAQGSEFAIMYRINAQSRMLEEAFLKAGLPYRLVGAQRFYGRREVKDMVAFLRLVHNPVDEISLRRVINLPPRKIGNKAVEKLAEIAQLADVSLSSVLLELAAREEESPYWLELERSARPLWVFGRLLAGWIKAAETASVPDLLDRIIMDIEYQEFVTEGSQEETIDRWGNVQELKRMSYDFEEQGLAAFLENLALVSDQDTVPEKADAPTLLTFHAAKGLEFDQVFIIGLDDGTLPHSRSFEEPEEMAEERRLFYVGITRARNKLYLVRAERRNMYGSYDAQLPSRFLKDVPQELVEEDQAGSNLGRLGRRSGGSQRRRGGWDSNQQDSYFDDWDNDYDNDSMITWESVQSRRAERSQGHAAILPSDQTPSQQPKRVKKTEPTYRPGMQVRHAKFGEGVVLNVVIEGDGEETVEIFFTEIKTQKKLAASFAKLDIIN